MRGVRVLLLTDEEIPNRVAERALAIPGVKLVESYWSLGTQEELPHPTLETPANALGLLKHLLGKAGIAYKVKPYRRKELRLGKRPRSVEEISQVTTEIKPEALERLLPYQREALNLFLPNGGGLAWMPCGSGKTFMAICWSLSTSQPGRLIVVTRSSTTHQWMSQFLEWTNLQPSQIALVEGEEGYQVRRSPPPYIYLRAYRYTPTELTEINPESLDVWIQGAYKASGQRLAPKGAREKAAQLWIGLTEDGAVARVVSNLRGRQTVEGPVESDAVWRVLEVAGLVRLEQQVDPPEWEPWQVYCVDADTVMDWWGFTDEVPLIPSEEAELLEIARDKEKRPEERYEALCYLAAGKRFLGQLKDRTPVLRGTEVKLIQSPTPDELHRFYDTVTEFAAQRRVHSLRSVPNFAPETRVVIVGDGVLSRRAPALSSWDPHTVILDESHTYKNPSRWEFDDATRTFNRKDHISAWADLVCEKADNVLLLTATPQEHKMRDWWAQLDLLDKGCFGKFKPRPPAKDEPEETSFAGRYCGGYRGEYAYSTSGQSNVAEFQARFRKVAYEVSLAVTHKHLPPLLRERVYLPIATAAKVRIPKQEFLAAKKRGAGALVELQLAINAQMKEPILLKTVLQEGQSDRLRMMVMLNRKAQVDRLSAQIRKYARKDYPIWAAHGETSIEDRREIIKQYRAAEATGGCIIGTSDAWGEALDGLQVTDLALIASLPPTIGKLIQLEGRWFRLGSLKSCRVRYLIMEQTIDEDMMDRTLSHAKEIDRISEGTDLDALVRTLEAGDEDALLAALAARICAENE